MSNKHVGSRLDDFMADEAMLQEATAVALKRVIAWQIAEEMKAQHLTKTALAKRMQTSRAALNRLLDEEDASLTLTTLASAAAALGKTISLQLTSADGTSPGAVRPRTRPSVGPQPKPASLPAKQVRRAPGRRTTPAA